MYRYTGLIDKPCSPIGNADAIYASIMQDHIHGLFDYSVTKNQFEECVTYLGVSKKAFVEFVRDCHPKHSVSLSQQEIFADS